MKVLRIQTICNLYKTGFFMIFFLNFQEFQPPKRPFKRMNYSEGIKWLKDNGVKKDDGSFYEYGEV